MVAFTNFLKKLKRRRDRGWKIWPGGAIRDAQGRCVICSVADSDPQVSKVGHWNYDVKVGLNEFGKDVATASDMGCNALRTSQNDKLKSLAPVRSRLLRALGLSE